MIDMRLFSVFRAAPEPTRSEAYGDDGSERPPAIAAGSRFSPVLRGRPPAVTGTAVARNTNTAVRRGCLAASLQSGSPAIIGMTTQTARS
jgi:hypothetical protein